MVLFRIIVFASCALAQQSGSTTISSDFLVFSTVPAYDAIDVNQDSSIVITFTKPFNFVQAIGNANPLYYIQINNAQPVAFTQSDYVQKTTETTLTIDLYQILKHSIAANSRVRFYFGTGLNTPIVDIDKNGISSTPFTVGESSKPYLQFTTCADEIPEINASQSVPTNGETSFSIEKSITITYSDFISLGQGVITLVPLTKEHYTITLDVQTSPSVTLSSSRTSIILSNLELLGNTDYYLVLAKGIIKSSVGTPSLAVTAGEYTFHTARDTIPPYIVAISPKSGSVSLPQNPKFIITFSEYIIPRNGLITFTNAQSSFTINVLSTEVLCEGKVCTITPRNTFTSGTYVMTFPITSFMDTSDNSLSTPCRDYIFNINGDLCNIEYLQQGIEENCKCFSTPTQCQCNCGETVLIKQY
ncbi:hypothetical protein WA158_005500 [Blastocystis sp. Blastoise]